LTVNHRVDYYCAREQCAGNRQNDATDYGAFFRRPPPLRRRQAPVRQNANDHELEGARTSGVTDLIVVVPAMEPCGCDIALRDKMGTREWFRKGLVSGDINGGDTFSAGADL